MNLKLNTNTKRYLFYAATLLVVGVAYAIGGFVNQTPAETAKARLTLGHRALTEGKGQLAIKLLTPLDKDGNAQADYWLADVYSNGVGVARDETKAIGYLKKAAAKGMVKAEAELGRLYAEGDHTVQNFAKAESWLSKAAMKGNAVSERDLGRLYEQGLGVTRNPVTAYAWYENAVLRGGLQAKQLRDQLVTKLASAELNKAETQAKFLNAKIGQMA